jgi:predicted Fe-Mo cluster-binding NifX family protein
MRLGGNEMQIFIYLIVLLVLPESAGSVPVPQAEIPSQKVAVTAQGPEMTSQIAPRFGQTAYIIVVEPDSDEARVIDCSRGFGTGADLANELINSGVEVVITGRLGPRVLRFLQAAKVKTIEGVSGTVGDALDRFKAGEFSESGTPGRPLR